MGSLVAAAIFLFVQVRLLDVKRPSSRFCLPLGEGRALSSYLCAIPVCPLGIPAS